MIYFKVMPRFYNAHNDHNLIVYDNGVDQAVGAGNIMVHKSK